MWQTDRRTDRQTDGHMEIGVLKAAWSQLKKICIRHVMCYMWITDSRAIILYSIISLQVNIQIFHVHPFLDLMMTSSNGNISRVTGHLCGNSPVSGEFPAQRPVTRSFDIFFDLRLNKRLSKQSWGWWFETLSCPLWRPCNVFLYIGACYLYLVIDWGTNFDKNFIEVPGSN